MSYNETLKRVNARKKQRIKERQIQEFKKTVLKPVSDNAGLVLGATALATVGFANMTVPMVFAEDITVESTEDVSDLATEKDFAVKNISNVHKAVVDTDKTEVKACTAGFSSHIADMSANYVPTTVASVDVVKNALVQTMCALEEKEPELSEEEISWNNEVAYCMAQDVNVYENWRTNLGKGKSNSKTRTHMSYKKVTSHCSMQYKVLNGANAWSSKYTGLRMVEDRYCVAVGLKYGVAGDKIDLVMEDGSVVKAIIGDIKSNRNTDETHMFQRDDGSIVELVTDGTPYDVDRVPAVLKQHITRIVNVEGMEF